MDSPKLVKRLNQDDWVVYCIVGDRYQMIKPGGSYRPPLMASDRCASKNKDFAETVLWVLLMRLIKVIRTYDS